LSFTKNKLNCWVFPGRFEVYAKDFSALQIVTSPQALILS